MMDSFMSIEDIIFQFVDQCKFIFFPEQWNKAFLDFSKNEVFVLLLLYRKDQVNMTEVAQYLGVPLNTVTGVINRLEKKELVRRERSKEDKRVVTIALTEMGKGILKEELLLMGHYFTRLMDEISEEERVLLFSIVKKAFDILSGEPGMEEKNQKKNIKRIEIE